MQITLHMETFTEIITIIIRTTQLLNVDVSSKKDVYFNVNAVELKKSIY